MKLKKKSGFTLIELLVVMTIIAILASAMVMGYGRMTQTAQRAKAAEAVSQAAQGLSILLSRTGTWPAAIISHHGGDGTGKGMVMEVAKEFAARNLLGVAKGADGNPVGISRFGVVDPWAEAVLKKKNSTIASRVSTGGTVQDHIIYYAIDVEGSGITEATVGGESIKVRATAITWSAGADGKLAPYSRRGRSDDIYSWAKGQVVK